MPVNVPVPPPLTTTGAPATAVAGPSTPKVKRTAAARRNFFTMLSPPRFGAVNTREEGISTGRADQGSHASSYRDCRLGSASASYLRCQTRNSVRKLFVIKRRELQ